MAAARCLARPRLHQQLPRAPSRPRRDRHCPGTGAPLPPCPMVESSASARTSATCPGHYWDYFDHLIPLTDRSLAEALEMNGFRVEEQIPRFLPWTMTGSLLRLRSRSAAYLRVETSLASDRPAVPCRRVKPADKMRFVSFDGTERYSADFKEPDRYSDLMSVLDDRPPFAVRGSGLSYCLPTAAPGVKRSTTPICLLSGLLGDRRVRAPAPAVAMYRRLDFSRCGRRRRHRRASVSSSRCSMMRRPWRSSRRRRCTC